MREPRQYTTTEVRRIFLQYCWMVIDTWDGYDKTCSEKIEGAVFSILAMMDGSSMDLPGFIVAPCPHPDDREFNEENGKNWFPENDDEAVQADIGGILHEMFYDVRGGDE